MDCMQIVSEILTILKSTNEHEKVLSMLIDRIHRLYHCQSTAVIIIDPKTEFLSIENSEGISYTFCKSFRTKIATGTIGQILWTGEPVLISSAEESSQIAKELMLEYPFQSAVAVQMAVNGRTLGYLHADSKERDAFSPSDVKDLQMFADFAGIAIVKAHLHEENMRLNPIDSETGALKFNTFYERLEEAFVRSKLTGEHFCIALLDVDNFKKIVRFFGHTKAQQLLREFVEAFPQVLKPFDYFGRFGFDEFIILLVNRDLEEAFGIMKLLSEAIHDSAFTTEKIRTSVSIGVAEYPRHGGSEQELILAAKRALFEAQRSGRNKVLSFEEKNNAFTMERDSQTEDHISMER